MLSKKKRVRERKTKTLKGTDDLAGTRPIVVSTERPHTGGSQLCKRLNYVIVVIVPRMYVLEDLRENRFLECQVDFISSKSLSVVSSLIVSCSRWEVLRVLTIFFLLLRKKGPDETLSGGSCFLWSSTFLPR